MLFHVCALNQLAMLSCFILFLLVLFVSHWMSGPNSKPSEISRMPHAQRKRRKGVFRKKFKHQKLGSCIGPALLLLPLNPELASLWPPKSQNCLFREQKEQCPLLEGEAYLAMVGRWRFCFVLYGHNLVKPGASPVFLNLTVLLTPKRT